MNEDLNHALQTYSNDILVTKNYFLTSHKSLFDISKLLRHTLDTSYDHDRAFNENFGVNLLEENQSWVITQYYIKQHQIPQLNEPFTVRTRVIDSNRFFVTRYFDVYNQDQLLYEVYTQYAVIDLNTRKMGRIDSQRLEEYNIIDKQFKPPFQKLLLPTEFEQHFNNHHEILESDIDENRHVNNLVYLRWSYSDLDLDFIASHQIDTIEVKYGKELLEDSKVEINTYILNNSKQTFQTVKEKDAKQVACSIRTKWRNK